MPATEVSTELVGHRDSMIKISTHADKFYYFRLVPILVIGGVGAKCEHTSKIDHPRKVPIAG
jgi:hypothetical protein